MSGTDTLIRGTRRRPMTGRAACANYSGSSGVFPGGFPDRPGPRGRLARLSHKNSLSVARSVETESGDLYPGANVSQVQ